MAQFRSLSGADYLAGCDFLLTGVVTLVDTNRDLVVLQDATGAVALHVPLADQSFEPGRRVTLSGTNCCPLLASFPDYPHRPSGREVRGSFESRMNWGEYNLTRMRGYLHPQVTGGYRFYIASDDSSELWLSTDSNPANARKIATVARFSWTEPRQWSKHPSQRSELIQLKAGETYYIEALQEQTVASEHLSVAWQEPAPGNSEITVIDGRYLTPWDGASGIIGPATNGVLREYWTNYFNGHLEGVAGARAYESALTVREVTVADQGPGELPAPEPVIWNRPLAGESNYCWVSAKGQVEFKATEDNAAVLEIFDGRALIPVRVLRWSAEESRKLKALTNAVVRVEGVCEGVRKPEGTIVPEVLWVPVANCVTLTEGGPTNEFATPRNQPAPVATSAAAMLGYFGTRGVVTFNERVFDKEIIVIQEGSSAWLITTANSGLKNQLRVGHYVDLGGALTPGNYVQTISPLFVVDMGWRSMPPPIINPDTLSSPGSLEGKWTELEGVARWVSTNGTLCIAGRFGTACLRIGQTPADSLGRLVDAKLRARGVLMLTMHHTPLLLVPSRDFIDVVEEPLQDPFAAPRMPIRNLLAADAESVVHRVRVAGAVTYHNAQSFFIQDASGGIRASTADEQAPKVGEWVEVVAFPALNGFVHTLIEPLVRPLASGGSIVPRDLDLGGALSSRQSGALVQVSATLLGRSTNSLWEVLELQEHQRVFAATLATGRGSLPEMAPGSRVRVTGVCDTQPASASDSSGNPLRGQFLGSLNILLRSPVDVVLLNGPPWWTWKRTATLVGALLTVLVVALLWVHLLHRRLERQQAAQLAFSRQVLEGVEDERRRIAVNLHDGLGQILLAIKNHALLAIQRPPEEEGLQQRLGDISATTTQAIDEVRRITRGLRPYQLDRLGLTQAVRAVVAGASENTRILFASRVEDIDGLFSKEGEIHVFRIVQEAVTNIAKHSAATEAAVVIKRKAKVVSLAIRDNGKGFDPARPSSQVHDVGFGLTGIAERVRVLGGTLAIDARPGAGTNLTVEVPLPISKHDTGNNGIDRG